MISLIEQIKGSLQEEKNIKLNKEQIKVLAEINLNLLKKKKFFNFFHESKNGIYLHGPAGRGKTVITKSIHDYFTEKKSKFIHFNDLIFLLQKVNFSNKNNLLNELKKNQVFFKNQKLICIDELEINDVADLVITEKFIHQANILNIFVIFTSNHKPNELYENNHHSELIKKFLKIILNQYCIIPLKTKNDYRKENSIFSSYLFEGSSKVNIDEMEILKKKIVGESKSTKKRFSRKGNSFELAGVYKNLIDCEFNDICGGNFNYKDYEILFRNVNFIFLKNIPRLEKNINDKIKRFIYLVDLIYEKKKILSISTLVPFKRIYINKLNNLDFTRTFSRLNEILSEKYIIDNFYKKHKL